MFVATFARAAGRSVRGAGLWQVASGRGGDGAARVTTQNQATNTNDEIGRTQLKLSRSTPFSQYGVAVGTPASQEKLLMLQGLNGDCDGAGGVQCLRSPPVRLRCRTNG